AVTCRVERPEAMTMWSAKLDLPSSGMVTRSCAWSASSWSRIRAWTEPGAAGAVSGMSVMETMVECAEGSGRACAYGVADVIVAGHAPCENGRWQHGHKPYALVPWA